MNFDDCIGKITSRSIGLYPVLIKKNLKFIKKWLFLVKKWEIQVITSVSYKCSNSSKPFKKIGIIILGLAGSFKTLNRPDPTRIDRNALWLLISRKVWKIGTWNFDTIFIHIFNLCYQNLESVSLIVRKSMSFWQRSNFGNFSSFFIITFDWTGIF